MHERVLILAPENATLYEPRLRGDRVQRLDYYHSYLKLLSLATDGATKVYSADSVTPLGFLRNVDLESLAELDARVAERRIRDTHSAASKERKRKSDELHAETERRRNVW